MTIDDWTADIQAAKAASIDGFALNIANDPYTETSLTNAYTAAQDEGDFSLFLSFDYGNYPGWTTEEVIGNISAYSSYSSQFRYGDNNGPLVSTFEGPDSATDWTAVKASTGCFFMPDWTSVQGNFANYLSQVDGAFSWDAWPWGGENKNTSSDESWRSILGSKPFMMGVSPWFYTNLPQYNKNWVWNGDDLWYDRWQQAIEFQPDLVEIITWNDFGESHYIGPIRESGIPSGSEWYVNGMPHDHWRDVLPYYVAAYKSGNSTGLGFTKEHITYHYRINPINSGSIGGTTGNSATQGQMEIPVSETVSDKVFFDVMVNAPADVSVQIGSGSTTALKASMAGVNHFSVPFNGNLGNVTITVSRSGQSVASITGPAITDQCTNGVVNLNAYVGSSLSS